MTPTPRPTTPGRYLLNRATGAYARDTTPDHDGDEIGADLCRHPDRPRKLLRVRSAGAAARAPPSLEIGPACADCENELRERAASDDGGPVWEGDALPVLDVDEVPVLFVDARCTSCGHEQRLDVPTADLPPTWRLDGTETWFCGACGGEETLRAVA